MLLDNPQSAHPWNMALLYLPFPAPASAFTSHQLRGLGWTGPSCPGAPPESADTKRTIGKIKPVPVPVPPSPAVTGLHITQMHKDSKRNASHRDQAVPLSYTATCIRRTWSPRQPSQTGFSLLASSSLESSTVAPLISTTMAAAAPQHKYEHLP